MVPEPLLTHDPPRSRFRVYFEQAKRTYCNWRSSLLLLDRCQNIVDSFFFCFWERDIFIGTNNDNNLKNVLLLTALILLQMATLLTLTYTALHQQNP